ncbi:hypothetical protein [Emticicia sp. W12TSBA100-4]|uniref:hypothetical protein n=1 Tax=Emticicia sp. W12TSBA100-4 TaxID=3160965 RepID=UPI003305676F
MAKIKTYEAFFEEIATKYKPIGHTPQKRQFASMSQAEILAGQRTKLDMTKWTMVLLKCEPKMVQNGSKQTRMMYVGAFEIVKKLDRNDLDKVQVQDDAFAMCIGILAKLLKMNLKREFPLGIIDENSIDFYPVDQVFDTAVGYGMEFRFDEGFCRNENYIDNDWDA